jgi:hypothetical protein
MVTDHKRVIMSDAVNVRPELRGALTVELQRDYILRANAYFPPVGSANAI